MLLITLLLWMVETTGSKFYSFVTSRARKPIQNLLILIFIFFIFCINYFQGYSGSFIFELELLNLIALSFVMLIPLFLFINSFLFRRNLLKGLSGLIFIIPAFVFTCVLYPAFIMPTGVFHTELVGKHKESKEYVIGVYEYITYGFHDSGHICRAWVRQKKIFPGIIRNKQLIHECYEQVK